MSSVDTTAVSRSAMAPEIEAAIAAVSLPEVRDMIRRLSKYHLAVCVPHMHLSEQDFAVLPPGMLQVEKQCVVSWAARGETANASGMVPVAWRWEENGVTANATCWGYCAKTPDGHDRVHDKVD